MHPFFQFAADYPWVSIALSIPTAFVLISISWCVTSMLTTTMSNLITLFTNLASLLVTLFRGYPPPQNWIADLDDDDDDPNRPNKDDTINPA